MCFVWSHSDKLVLNFNHNFQANISQAESHVLEQQREEQGMYRNLKTPQLLLLTDCLMESHCFARDFNKDHDQSINILTKSGMSSIRWVYSLEYPTESNVAKIIK